MNKVSELLLSLPHRNHETSWRISFVFCDWCFLTALQPVPHPYLLPCCLPKPIPTPQALHGHIPIVSAPACPEANLRELRQSGFPPPLALALHVSRNSSPLKSPAGWDLNHISRSLFGGVKQTEIQVEARRAGSDAQMGGREWRRGTNYIRWTAFPFQIPQIHPFCIFVVVYYSLSVI